MSEIPTPKLESLENPVIELKTNYGNIFIELYKDKAPKTVENFLKYVNSGLYDGVVFHRVIKDFMIQGGGLDVNLSMKKTLKPIKNEADNGLKNDRGTIAMARTKAPHSASNQFFINVKDNDFLNFKSKTADGYGYCVFGKVVYGMKVVDDIQKVPVTIRKGYYNVPLRDVIIKKALQLR
ncbi:peptidyl-prolyl cis-trans isomerase [Lentisphaerae bacterium WC36]|nr:peptidyl-prolyl cis-trans isomerase [Lentisphaerae bacterium WC36]